MSTKDKWVHRFSVDKTAKHKNGFTIYKITSVLFPLKSPEAVTTVSVWKRYSDVQQLHKSVRVLHSGLHLRGKFPTLVHSGYFTRFQPEVIEERAKSIKTLLEFIAEHKLLFASTDFVNFLQSGYPAPESEETQSPASPLDGGTAAEDILHVYGGPVRDAEGNVQSTGIQEGWSGTSEEAAGITAPSSQPNPDETIDEVDNIPNIPIFESADIELRESPKKLSTVDSFDSISSMESLDGDIYDELSKMTVDRQPCVKTKPALPDLINFDAPSTSKYEDYHTMPKRSSASLSRCSSVYSVSLSSVEGRSRTEDSYVFEAGLALSEAARSEAAGAGRRAFSCYVRGVETMLRGAQTDPDPHRRRLIKEKIDKYISHAEDVYKNHMCDDEQNPVTSPRPAPPSPRPYCELSLYRVLAVLSHSIMLVIHRDEQKCYAMKVIRKVPNNLTEFDNYFQRQNETKQPILPTGIPYMVPLRSYIQTNNLIFLILTYAPGQKLIDYLKNYAKSTPNTPSREVNLENVFAEPKKMKSSDMNSSINETLGINSEVSNRNNNIVEEKTDCDEVSEIVRNSQKLLNTVDEVLNNVKNVGLGSGVVSQERDIEAEAKNKAVERMKTPVHKLDPPRVVSPPASIITLWGAEILLAIECLHNAGVVCRDLNTSNILLGERGQVTLTYMIGQPGADMRLSTVRGNPGAVCIAPEMMSPTDLDDERVGDYWSYGVIMYELICGEPVSLAYGVAPRIPAQVSLEAQSLLTQLLTIEPTKRLGYGGVDEIKRHPYYKHIDWTHLYDSWSAPD